MPSYVSTINFTSQGSVAIRDTVKRSKAFKSAARKLGVKVRETYWTQGPFDGLIIFDAPDEEAVAALMLGLNSLGNVQTQTSRAFNAAEMAQILSKIE
jgi:uncharacterized protein with GYD domain